MTLKKERKLNRLGVVTLRFEIKQRVEGYYAVDPRKRCSRLLGDVTQNFLRQVPVRIALLNLLEDRQQRTRSGGILVDNLIGILRVIRSRG